MIKNIVLYFDHLEDRIRGKLSSFPILYAFIASIGIILLRRGVWHTADSLNISGPVSALIGLVILLLSGIFVSGFIGNRLLLTGIRNEKKLAEKTKSEIERDIQSESETLRDIKKAIIHIEKEISSDKESR